MAKAQKKKKQQPRHGRRTSKNTARGAHSSKRCPHCSGRLVRRGFRRTRRAKKQLYLCTRCRRKVTLQWPRMRFDKGVVMAAANLYASGLSSSKVRERLAERGVRVSRWTIIKWYNRFG